MIHSESENQTIGKQSQKYSPKSSLWKIGLIQTILLSLLGIIAVRLVYLQLVIKNDLQLQARRQYESRIELKPKRGAIYDVNNLALASSAISYSYAIDPKTAVNPEQVARIAAFVSGDSASVWLEKIKSCKTSFLWLFRGRETPIPELETLLRQGVIRIVEPRRRYPFREIGGQVVGTANVDNIGVSGVEVVADSLLRGKPGYAVMLRDGRGTIRSALDVSNSPPSNGANIIVTLDMRLQQIAEYELRKGIETSQASSGIVIAIEPSTGEIRAICSYPTFDPTSTSKLLSDATRIRGISDMYEPGSTFKIVASAALLEEKMIAPSDSVYAENGVYRVGNFEVKDTHPLGMITFRQALEQSSNIVFAKETMKIPDGKFYKYARDFGFGVLSGIDLPGEISGVLKKPRQFDKTSKMFMGYGYELSASALQITDAYAALANGGVLMKPYIIKKVISDDGQNVFTAKPQAIRRVVSAATTAALTNMLTGVVENGTGSEAKIAGLEVAGKTGTAQQVVEGIYSKEAYTASFAGFFPAKNPKLVMVIMLDHPKSDIYGGKTAAPIFRKIAERWAGGIGVENAEKQQNQQFSIDSTIVPEVRGIISSGADDILHGNGLRMMKQYDGIVVRQNVQPGIKVRRGSSIIVETRPIMTETSKNFQKQNMTFSKPDVRGISLRRALAILHNSGVMVKATGRGKVVNQIWKSDSSFCTVECKN